MSKKKYQIELNSVTKKLPKHLHKFIVKQPYEDYTAQNVLETAFENKIN